MAGLVKLGLVACYISLASRYPENNVLDPTSEKNRRIIYRWALMPLRYIPNRKLMQLVIWVLSKKVVFAPSMIYLICDFMNGSEYTSEQSPA